MVPVALKVVVAAALLALATSLTSAGDGTQGRMACGGSQPLPAPTDAIPDQREARSPPCAEARPIEPPHELASMVGWIARRTGWDVYDAPRFRIVADAELARMLNVQKASHYRIESLYSPVERTVYLPESWRPDDLRDRSILLHELVHHLQHMNNVKEVCLGDYEYQATELQMAWLREQGVDDPLDLLGVNSLFVHLLRQCGE